MSARGLIGAAVMLLLAACGSSPKTQYFTLAMEPGSGAKPAIDAPVTVADVTLPPTLDRRETVRLTGRPTRPASPSRSPSSSRTAAAASC